MTTTTAPAPRPTPADRRDPVRAAGLVALLVTWAVAWPVLAAASFFMSLSFFGAPVEPADQRAATLLALATAVVAVGLPLAAAQVAVRATWQHAAAACRVLAGVGGAAALALLLLVG